MTRTSWCSRLRCTNCAKLHRPPVTSAAAAPGLAPVSQNDAPMSGDCLRILLPIVPPRSDATARGAFLERLAPPPEPAGAITRSRMAAVSEPPYDARASRTRFTMAAFRSVFCWRIVASPGVAYGTTCRQ
jgi:hypothetical protein